MPPPFILVSIDKTYEQCSVSLDMSLKLQFEPNGKRSVAPFCQSVATRKQRKANRRVCKSTTSCRMTAFASAPLPHPHPSHPHFCLFWCWARMWRGQGKKPCTAHPAGEEHDGAVRVVVGNQDRRGVVQLLLVNTPKIVRVVQEQASAAAPANSTQVTLRKTRPKTLPSRMGRKSY